MGIKNRIKKVLNRILKMNTSSSSTGTPSIVIQEINHPHQQNSQDIISTYPNYTHSEIDNMEDLNLLNDYSNYLNEQSLILDASIERLQQDINRTRTQINQNYVNFNNQPQQYINRTQTQIQNYANLNYQPQQYINRAQTQPSHYVYSFGNGMPIGRAATTSNIPNQSINFNPPNDTNTQSTYHNYTDAEINNMSLDELNALSVRLNEQSLRLNTSIDAHTNLNDLLQDDINRTRTQIQNNDNLNNQLQQDINRTQTQINQLQQDINDTPIAEEAPPSYVSVVDDPYLYQNNETPEQSNILTRSDSSRSVHSNTSIASSTRTENSMAVNTGHNVGSDISTHNQSTASSSYYSIGSTLRGLIEENNYYYDNIDNMSLTSANSRQISTGTSDNLSQPEQATPTLHKL